MIKNSLGIKKEDGGSGRKDAMESNPPSDGQVFGLLSARPASHYRVSSRNYSPTGLHEHTQKRKKKKNNERKDSFKI